MILYNNEINMSKNKYQIYFIKPTRLNVMGLFPCSKILRNKRNWNIKMEEYHGQIFGYH